LDAEMYVRGERLSQRTSSNTNAPTRAEMAK
jgi:hypothetical protein